jgi:hypothetical protein
VPHGRWWRDAPALAVRRRGRTSGIEGERELPPFTSAGADVSLVSCDTISTTELHQPPIAVVRRDTAELGRRAAELLLLHPGASAAPEGVTLRTELVAHPSCAPPREAR